MSKSLGNFVTVHDLLGQAPGEAIRLAMLSTHYHQPFDWTAEGLRAARTTLDRLYLALRGVTGIAPEGEDDMPEGVRAALEDDLNTPLAIAGLHELAGALNKAATDAEKARAKGALLAAGRMLGVLQQDPEDWLRWSPDGQGDGLDEAAIETLITQRLAARKAKDFAEADRIRADLLAQGVILEDGAGGTSWRRQ